MCVRPSMNSKCAQCEIAGNLRLCQQVSFGRRLPRRAEQPPDSSVRPCLVQTPRTAAQEISVPVRSGFGLTPGSLQAGNGVVPPEILRSNTGGVRSGLRSPPGAARLARTAPQFRRAVLILTKRLRLMSAHLQGMLVFFDSSARPSISIRILIGFPWCSGFLKAGEIRIRVRPESRCRETICADRRRGVPLAPCPPSRLTAPCSPQVLKRSSTRFSPVA